jgi:exonuclease SbcC
VKLKRLSMKAFGSYGGETVIPFDELASSLYLVRGNTGAGKTTIFDAVVFALYGKSSGGKRTFEMMHSDFASPGEGTRVELVFSHAGRTHRVVRTQDFVRHRDGTASLDSPQAEFCEEGRPPIRGATAVTRRIAELLGLDADQFSQIVMLAQGDFRKFLEAKSDEKTQILSRVFDTSPYRALERLLSDAAAELWKQRRGDEEAVRLAIEKAELPDDLSPEEAAKLKPRDETGRVRRSPTAAEDFASLLAQEREQAAAAQARYEALDAAYQRLLERKALAETRNRRLDALDAALRRQEELASRQEKTEETRRLLAKGRRAAAVRAAVEAVRIALNARDASRDAVAESEKALAAARTRAEAAEAGKAAVEANQEKIRALAAEAETLARVLPSYDGLAACVRSLAGHRQAAAKASETAEKERKTAARLAAERERAAQELRALENARAEAVAAEAETRRAGETAEAARKVCAGAEAVAAEEKRLAAARAELVARGEEAVAAKGRWSALYAAFVRAQAGLLAEGLANEIRETGRGTCPVCGTEHGEVASAFARLDGDAPHETAVEEARRRFEEAEAVRAALQAETAAAASALEERKNALVQAARALPGGEGAEWGQISGGNWRRERLSAAEETEKEAKNRQKEAEKAEKHRQTLVAEAETLGKRLENAEKAAKTAETEAAEHEKAAAGAEGERQQLLRSLPCPAKEEAEALLRGKREELRSLQRTVDDAVAAVQSAKEAVAAGEAALAARKEALAEKETALAAARGNLETALAKNGYADVAAWRADAAPLPEGEVEGWLEGLRGECERYDAETRENANLLSSLRAETAGFVREDAGALQANCEAADAERKRALDGAAERARFVREHGRLLEDIRGTEARLARSEGGMKRLWELARLATGEHGAGKDRVDFERFMLADTLREVLEQANVRLDRMCGGRFELVHRAEGRDGRTAAGLDIDVADHATGARRQAASFSGGEGFFASMALALGLADTVRNRAGGVELDSTFIDEGFGSLDDAVLDNCIRVLKDLAGGTRQVGIISHVAKLEEDVWPQIAVSSGPRGSTARIEKR